MHLNKLSVLPFLIGAITAISLLAVVQTTRLYGADIQSTLAFMELAEAKSTIVAQSTVIARLWTAHVAEQTKAAPTVTPIATNVPPATLTPMVAETQLTTAPAPWLIPDEVRSELQPGQCVYRVLIANQMRYPNGDGVPNPVGTEIVMNLLEKQNPENWWAAVTYRDNGFNVVYADHVEVFRGAIAPEPVACIKLTASPTPAMQ